MKNIHVLPTDKPSRLCINGKNGQHIFITSDEEIKKGDWFLVIGGIGLVINTRHKSNGDTPKNDWLKKIILTTDQDLINDGIQAIDDEFLEWFVKNLNCEFVEVIHKFDEDWSEESGAFEIDYYKIIIPQEEPNPCKDIVINDKAIVDVPFHNKHIRFENLTSEQAGYLIQVSEFYQLSGTRRSAVIPQEEPKQDYSGVHLRHCYQGEYEDGCKYGEDDCPAKPLEEPKQEIWKDIPHYEGLYQVSNFGNVKSLERYVKGKIKNRLQKENILSKRLVGDKGNQYYAVTLCNNKDRKQVKVSVLVAMAFLNHTPNGYGGFTVDHIDNNPLNNNIDNLQVITKRENSSKDRKGVSKYTGVTFNKKSNKWKSQIWIDGKNKTLGSFDDELEAHRAYQKELQQHLKS
jgi:hypothetical protein